MTNDTRNEKFPDTNRDINWLESKLVLKVIWICEEQVYKLIGIVHTRKTNLGVLYWDKDTMLG